MTQHAGLGPERWREFTLDEQILMIANEMNRASKRLRPEDRPALQLCYERILNLVDLTIEVSTNRSLWRELLRWREVVGALYITPAPDVAAHQAAFRVLLRFTPEASKQIPYVIDRA